MSDKTKIEWTDATWNPIRGCSRVSEGCRNCYAESVANRFKGEGQPYEGLIAKGGQWNGTIKVVDRVMNQPLRWKKPRRIFVNSMSDLFHPGVSVHTTGQIFKVMAEASHHTFQILTKRPEQAKAILSCMSIAGHPWPLPNVWLGVSVEDQATADERIPLLLSTPAAVRWISAEPLIGQICFSGRWVDDPPAVHINWLEALDWVVVGGESGKDARPMQANWARILRDQCADVGTPFLFKQWGEYAPNWFTKPNEAGQWEKIEGSEWMDRMGKRKAGRELDGRMWDQYPPRYTSIEAGQ